MFQKATKEKSKLRCAIFGPSGSGKTFTALRMAKGIGGRIALGDTEYGSASKYADRFEFDTCNLQKATVDNYVAMIQYAGKAGYDVLIVDGMSHGWQELLEEVDRLAMTKYKGNTWSAWSEGTPKQRSLVKAILACPCHIIATMRSKTEWTTQADDRGRVRPMRVGLSPEQGKGIEYEFDLLMEMSTEHVATIIKDRTGRFQDVIISKPGEEFGGQLAAWLNDGRDIAPQQPQQQPQAASPAPQQQATQGTGQPPQQPQQNYQQAQQQQQPQAQQPQENSEVAHWNSTMEAIADFFRQKIAAEMPGLVLSVERLSQVVLNRYGKYPSTPTGASKVKAEVRMNDVAIPGQQRVA